MHGLRNYAVVTAAYWGFTLTDGALRMLVLLHFHTLGYSPLELASLFLLYEFFGVVTNLVGGWIGARMGLKVTLYVGLGLQIAALAMLSGLDPGWPRIWSVVYVVAAQGVAGIAKDLTKMSSKSAIKTVVPDGAGSVLFRWVALLTGSKNALKGAGFFLGGFLLTALGFVHGLWVMAAGLAVVLALILFLLPSDIGRAKSKVPFKSILAKNKAINLLSTARFFLFGARDVWFVVALPVFLYETLGWSFMEVGGFMAAWVIGYGAVQAAAPMVVRRSRGGAAAEVVAARLWGWGLASLPVAIAAALQLGLDPAASIIVGLALFGVAFAVNSSVHSYLILAYSERDNTALDVGFYYMANAGGRLLGTLLSGLIYQAAGLEGSLLGAGAMVAVAAALAMLLPAPEAKATTMADASGD